MALLLAAGVAALGHVVGFDFIELDDGLYVTENRLVQGGITYAGVTGAFTKQNVGLWHPLTWLSHMLDCQLYDLNPSGHHLTSLMLHLLNTLLLFAFLRLATGDLWPSAFVAALFCLHPQHVESVAWVSSRKDVLSGLFWMLGLLAYLRYTESKRPWAYAAVFMAYLLGLMAKPMVITFPFVLLLLDVWPLNRLNPAKGQSSSILARAKPLILEKVPLFVMTLLFTVTTLYASRTGGSLRTLDEFNLLNRILNPLAHYGHYLLKTVYPTGLGAPYVHSDAVLPLWQAGAGVAVLTLLTLLSLGLFRRAPYLLVGWLWFLGTFVPIIGVIPVGIQSVADRYTYIPLIGLFIMMGWSAKNAVPGASAWRRITAACAVAIVLVCGVSSRLQANHWRDNLAFNTRGLIINPDTDHAHSAMANALIDRGRYGEAIEFLEKAIRIGPNNPKNHNLMGVAHMMSGRLEVAMSYYKEALRLDAKNADAYSNFGNAILSGGDAQQAVEYFMRALELEPDHPDASSNIGGALLLLNQPEAARKHLIKAVEITPRDEITRVNLAVALFDLGERDRAMGECLTALRLNPDYEKARLFIEYMKEAPAEGSK